LKLYRCFAIISKELCRRYLLGTKAIANKQDVDNT